MHGIKFLCHSNEHIKCRINCSVKEKNYEAFKTSLNSRFEKMPLHLQDNFLNLMPSTAIRTLHPFWTAVDLHVIIDLFHHKMVCNDLFRLIVKHANLLFSRTSTISALLYESRSSMRWSREDNASLRMITLWRVPSR